MTTKKNHIDVPTLTCVLLLMVLSLGVVYSASSTRALDKSGSSEAMMLKHAVKIGLGFAALFIFMNIDYKKYIKYTKPVLIASALLLVLTLALGGEVKGATRWLRLGGLGLQPSELAKYALIFHLCALITMKKERIRDFTTGFLPMMVWIGLITLLVLLQPNFSTGVMLLAISLVLLFVGRAKMVHVALTFVALLPPLAAYMISAPYRMERIMGFIGFAGDAGANVTHQLWQGIIGFGNGGMFGVGMGESKQRDYFLPESYGDFVFSIVGEEYGLIGTLGMLALFMILLLRGMRIARYAEDDFGRLLAVGITSSISLYALINASVTLGLLPTTGLPMPFVSYGGSSMLFSSIAVGVLLNISAQTDLHPRFTLKSLVKRQRPEPTVGQVF